MVCKLFTAVALGIHELVQQFISQLVLLFDVLAFAWLDYGQRSCCLELVILIDDSLELFAGQELVVEYQLLSIKVNFVLVVCPHIFFRDADILKVVAF